MQIKPLIDVASPQYRTRLVREINARLAGGPVYAAFPSGNYRVRGVRAQAGTLQVLLMSATRWQPAPASFNDGAGNDVVASREAAR